MHARSLLFERTPDGEEQPNIRCGDCPFGFKKGIDDEHTHCAHIRVSGMSKSEVTTMPRASEDTSERVVVEGLRLGRLPPRDRHAFAKLLHKQRALAKRALEASKRPRAVPNRLADPKLLQTAETA